MKTLVYWIIAVALLAGGFVSGMFIIKTQMSEQLAAANAAAVATATSKPEPLHLWLTPDEVEASGVAAEPVDAGTLTPELTLFGLLQEDPNESFTVRAPGAGTIRAGVKGWPVLGERLEDNTTVGMLEPRAQPADLIALATQRVALQAQVATAQTDWTTAQVALSAAQTDYERQKKLNEQDKNVADKVVEEAQAKVKTEEAHVAGAKEALEVAKAALASVDAKLTPLPLMVVHGGETVEIDGQPEESVESGQTLLRVARWDHLVAAINVPLGQEIPASVKEARIVPMNGDTSPLAATRLGTAAAVDPKTKDGVLMFRLAVPGGGVGNSGLRPGAPVTAYLPLGGSPLKGVVVPRKAIVRYNGKAWVYIWGEVRPDKQQDFERREVVLDHPTPDGQGWLVMQGIKPEEKVVTTGAAVLLSKEANTFGGD